MADVIGLSNAIQRKFELDAAEIFDDTPGFDFKSYFSNHIGEDIQYQVYKTYTFKNPVLSIFMITTSTAGNVLSNAISPNFAQISSATLQYNSTNTGFVNTTFLIFARTTGNSIEFAFSANLVSVKTLLLVAQPNDKLCAFYNINDVEVQNISLS